MKAYNFICRDCNSIPTHIVGTLPQYPDWFFCNGCLQKFMKNAKLEHLEFTVMFINYPYIDHLPILVEYYKGLENKTLIAGRDALDSIRSICSNLYDKIFEEKDYEPK